MSWLKIIDLIVNSISAIGTFGAAAIALYLALQGQRQRMDCVFAWDTATGSKPMLILNNIGNRTVVIDRVDLFFHKQKVGSYNVLKDPDYSDNAIIAPSKGVGIVLKSDAVNIDKKDRYWENAEKTYDLRAVVITANKKRYKVKQRCCYNDISELFFLDGFNGE